MLNLQQTLWRHVLGSDRAALTGHVQPPIRPIARRDAPPGARETRASRSSHPAKPGHAPSRRSTGHEDGQALAGAREREGRRGPASFAATARPPSPCDVASPFPATVVIAPVTPLRSNSVVTHVGDRSPFCAMPISVDRSSARARLGHRRRSRTIRLDRPGRAAVPSNRSDQARAAGDDTDAMVHRVGDVQISVPGHRNRVRPGGGRLESPA